ncbi:hypothetical protein A2765_05810 [Candidatus Kaiserbacteria bacterium RIFCSPHIGHO2_01_FULL_56_24]|uniref:Uncharacterized protein n=1 Tax=Candidatus Kaiserbacteria bacterium RIFCSPHIGHO2_01_FULL_56_24 TaxID=1798487 RepID=A0A1F6DAJ5_9BACT|nr:MAG: hypothetical protein A2765_05810 [Candidatus Kaiserbacteria bacterium RIFCSPHIGHO2_01_FULL_56_24]
MPLIIEEDGASYDVSVPEQLQAFDDYVETLDAEGRRRMREKVLCVVDESFRERGYFCGLPLKTQNDDGPDFVGYHIEGNHSSRKKEAEEASDKPRLINRWKTRDKNGDRGYVSIYEKDGKRTHCVTYRDTDMRSRFLRLISTYAARQKSNPASAEKKAQEKLCTLISPNKWDDYVLSDMFIEIGKSGVMYLLRKGYPTVAFRSEGGKVNMLAALCMHPLGYYQDTFAGAMVPTDELITHLLFIRADEHDLWKRANHHNPEDPMSGI